MRKIVRRRWKTVRKLTAKGYQKKRSRSHRKEFVRGGADPKIRIYDMGERSKSLNSYDARIGLVITHDRRVSHLTMEAIRITINRRLVEALGKDGFHLRIRSHPYDVYREHAMMSFAGADRISSGMRQSFGRPVGKCCRLKARTIMAECGVPLKAIEEAKKAFKIAASKVCVKCIVVLLSTSKPELAPKVPLPSIKKYVTQRSSI